MAFRFLHTADWQIGMQASGLGGAGAAVREARLESVSRLLELAHEHQVDAILVAGDQFEHNQVDAVQVERVARVLDQQTQIPVYLLPGNHDPYSRDSVYRRPVWDQLKEHVRVLARPEPLTLAAGVTLYPCPLTESHGFEDPTAWIPDRQPEDGLRLGLAHGSLQLREDIGEEDFPIPPDACQRRGLDYLALGHWHSTLPDPDTDPDARARYSGTHEQTRFGEHDSGNALLVSLAGPGERPRVERVPVGRLRWQKLTLDLDSAPLDHWAGELRKRPDAAQTLLRIQLQGAESAETAAGLAGLQRLLDEQFLHASLDASGLRPLAVEAELQGLLQSRHLLRTAQELERLAGTAPGAEGAVDPAAARRALQMLQQLAWDHRSGQ